MIAADKHTVVVNTRQGKYRLKSRKYLTMSSQMVLTGEAGCPTFSPNMFKADICSLCQNKIQSHSYATDSQVKYSILDPYNCHNPSPSPKFKSRVQV